MELMLLSSSNSVVTGAQMQPIVDMVVATSKELIGPGLAILGAIVGISLIPKILSRFF